MSVIIKGMDMPKKGVYNAVITFDGDSISFRIPPSKEPFFSGRIVHVPTPHGRLIDAYALLKIIKESGMLTSGICWAINVTPTIIEAEVSE